MAIDIALMGAGGKMGCRITDKIKDNSNYNISYIEISEQGIANLAERGLSPTPQDEALPKTEVVILAIPDALIGKITHEVIPILKPGTMVIGLDPAAAYAEVMPIRDDLTYFVSHPCHPPLFLEETTPEARIDWFGGIAAQHIVCALHRGPEADYAKGEAIACDMFGPILQSHRITVEQMAVLEPALVETFTATVMSAVNEALEEAIKMGVPEAAAREFFMGHLRTIVAICFGIAGFPFSDGAKLAIEKAKSRIFKPDWKENIMSLDSIRQSVAEITHSIAK